MSSKKIWQYPEATSITNDDYILMDSNTETGSQCLKANKIGAVHITKTVTERKVYKASDDNANGFSEVTVAVPYTDVHYDKDDIVSFVGEDLPLKSVTAYIEPQQDLHGYDAPWVGGAGKNKFDIDATHEEVSGSATYSYIVTVKANTSYTMSCNVPQGSPASLYFNGTTTNTNGVWNGMPRTFTSDASGQFIVYVRYDSSQGGIDLYTAVKNGTYYIQLEEGSTATSFAPYSNICPISGWDEAVDVNVCGVNVWDEEWEVGGLNPLNGETTSENDRIRSKNFRPCKPNMTMFYYIPSGKGNLQIVFYDINKNYLDYYNFTTEHTFTIPNGCYFFKFNTGGSYGTTYNNDISINYPSTDTEYHAYNGQTYTLDLDGTRYGGKLDVVSGVMTVDRAIKTVADCYWYGSNGFFYTGTVMNEIVHGDGRYDHCISDVYATKNVAQSSSLVNGEMSVDASGYLQLKDARYSSTSDFKTAMGTSQLVYELATPLTIQLTPTQVNSLLGVNNVWADTGEIAVEWQTLYVTPTT